jgi:hypothetical protein
MEHPFMAGAASFVAWLEKDPFSPGENTKGLRGRREGETIFPLERTHG